MILASFLCALIGAGCAFTLTWGLSRTPSSREASKAAPALSFVGSTTLSMFVLCLGFLVASSWQEHGTARDHSYSEARALATVYAAAGGLADGDRTQVRSSLRQYVTLVVDDEWPMMGRHRSSAAAWLTLDQADGTLERLAGGAGRPTPAQALAVSNTSKAMEDVYQMRSQRISDVRWTVLPQLEYALVATGLLVLLFPALVGINAGPRHLVMMVLLGAVLGFGIFLVISLQHPFSGPTGISPAAYTQAVARFDQLDAQWGATP